MNISEIEASSFADLKANREVVIETAKQQSVDVLAVYYVKALTDTKHRDEKLGEQGKTITALQDALVVARAQLGSASLRADVGERERDFLAVEMEQVRQRCDTDKAAIVRSREVVQEALQQETARANRLKAEATRYHAVMAQVLKLATVAVGVTAVEAADAGQE